MQLSDLDLTKSYTYADYLKWNFEERVELIKGKIFKMSPSPNTAHQRISSRLHLAIGNYLQGKKCEVFSAPFDVRIPRKSKDNKDIITVLQPDICVICDAAKIEEQGCLGAPDFVIEILSPANRKKELKYKHNIYQEAGVKEYWVIDPTDKSVQVYLLLDSKLLADGHLYAEDQDIVTSTTIPGLSVDLSALFNNLK
jgi:Uma2 family endonuclease